MASPADDDDDGEPTTSAELSEAAIANPNMSPLTLNPCGAVRDMKSSDGGGGGGDIGGGGNGGGGVGLDTMTSTVALN